MGVRSRDSAGRRKRNKVSRRKINGPVRTTRKTTRYGFASSVRHFTNRRSPTSQGSQPTGRARRAATRNSRAGGDPLDALNLVIKAALGDMRGNSQGGQVRSDGTSKIMDGEVWHTLGDKDRP